MRKQAWIFGLIGSLMLLNQAQASPPRIVNMTALTVAEAGAWGK